MFQFYVNQIQSTMRFFKSFCLSLWNPSVNYVAVDSAWFLVTFNVFVLFFIQQLQRLSFTYTVHQTQHCHYCYCSKWIRAILTIICPVTRHTENQQQIVTASVCCFQQYIDLLFVFRSDVKPFVLDCFVHFSFQSLRWQLQWFFFRLVVWISFERITLMKNVRQIFDQKFISSERLPQAHQQ